MRAPRCSCLLILLTLATAASASASTTITSDSGTSYPYQRWVDRAKVPTPDVTLRVVEQGCGSTTDYYYAAGCTSPGSYRIQVAPQPTTRVAKRIFLHELGHNFDYSAISDADRQAFMAIVGLGDWRPAAHELFAEAYGTCAGGGWRHRVIGEVTQLPPLRKRQMVDVCYLIRH